MSYDMMVGLANTPTNISTFTIVATTAGFPITLPTPSLGIRVRAEVLVTLGTGATGITIQFGRPDGTNFAFTTFPTLVAGNTYSLTLAGLDNKANAYANASYNVQVRQEGAPTAAGNVVRASLEVDVVSQVGG